MIYLLKCEQCHKHNIGSTINSFRKRFHNHDSNLLRYGKGKRGMEMEKGVYQVSIYICIFFAESHVGLTDVRVKIIDRTDVTKPKEREALWAFKLNSFVPQGLNLRDFM